jgi:hypothetical protein
VRVRVIVECGEGALSRRVGGAVVDDVEVDRVACCACDDCESVAFDGGGCPWGILGRIWPEACIMDGKGEGGVDSPDAQSRHWLRRRRASEASAKRRERWVGLRREGSGEDGADCTWRWWTQPQAL